jgi:hypothetical protein
MQSRDRRTVDAESLGAIAVMATLTTLVAAIVVAWLSRIPLPDEAAAPVGVGDAAGLHADGETPMVLARQDGVLRLAEMHLGLRPLLRLQTPKWHLRSTSTETARTTEPTSLTIVWCQVSDQPCEQPVTLVGEITDQQIEQIKIRVNEEVRQVFARSPGYIKHLSRHVCLDGIRSEDASGRVVWPVDVKDDEAFDRCLDGR